MQTSKRRFIIGAAIATLIIWVVMYFWLSSNLTVGNDQQETVVFDTYTQLQLPEQTVRLTVAQSPAQLERGLGDWERINENEGMLFELGKKEIPYFWMKNVEFPIDIIWVDGSTIIDISQGVQPQPGVSDNELTLYMPSEPVDRVIEVTSGFASKYGLSIGDELLIDTTANN